MCIRDRLCFYIIHWYPNIQHPMLGSSPKLVWKSTRTPRVPWLAPSVIKWIGGYKQIIHTILGFLGFYYILRVLLYPTWAAPRPPPWVPTWGCALAASMRDFFGVNVLLPDFGLCLKLHNLTGVLFSFSIFDFCSGSQQTKLVDFLLPCTMKLNLYLSHFDMGTRSMCRQ